MEVVPFVGADDGVAAICWLSGVDGVNCCVAIAYK